MNSMLADGVDASPHGSYFGKGAARGSRGDGEGAQLARMFGTTPERWAWQFGNLREVTTSSVLEGRR